MSDREKLIVIGASLRRLARNEDTPNWLTAMLNADGGRLLAIAKKMPPSPWTRVEDGLPRDGRAVLVRGIVNINGHDTWCIGVAGYVEAPKDESRKWRLRDNMFGAYPYSNQDYDPGFNDEDEEWIQEWRELEDPGPPTLKGGA